MTREHIADFIEEVAGGHYSREDWERIAVNHYHDKTIEQARRELVRYMGGHKSPESEGYADLKEALLDLAKRLRKAI